MKRSQVAGQVFIYILSIVILAAILLYGYTAISDFRQRSSDITSVKLQKDITSAIERIASDYGSVQKKDFSLGEYLSICFVDTYENTDSNNFPSGTSPLIKGEVESKTGNNVFLLTDTVGKKFNTGPIKVDKDTNLDGQDDNILCLRGPNTIHIRLEGKGDHTLVSEWEG